MVETGAVDWTDLPRLAEECGVDADELRMLCAMATNLWRTLKPSFPDARTEVEFRMYSETGIEFMLTGHVDLISYWQADGRKGLRGADWKSGRKDFDYGQQMRAYCALALLEDGTLDEATFTLIWLRSGDVETYTMRREEVTAWLDTVAQKVVAWDNVYHPGPHCNYCPRSHECAARTAMIRRDVSAFLDSTVMSEAIVPAAMIGMARRAKMVKKAAEDALAIIKAYVEKHGAIEGEGVALVITETPTRKLDVAKAWPVLEDSGFVDEDFTDAVTLSVTKVEKRIAQKAGKGNGAAAVRMLGQQLEAAGAVILGSKRTLEEVRR